MMRALDPAQREAGAVREMFEGIAPRYDLLNRVLSAGFDQRWRAKTVEEALRDRGAAGAAVLDICCGTGDLAIRFQRSRRGPVSVTGVDFSEAMVGIARGKRSSVRWLVGDALSLPLGAERFDVVSVAFGLRNLVEPRAGIRECWRVLRPGGRLVIAEFFKPPASIRAGLFRFYFRRVLPWIGRLLCGSSTIDAYRYLPESVESFASPEEVVLWMEDVGFRQTQTRPLTIGAVCLISGSKTRAVTTQDSDDPSTRPAAGRLLASSLAS